MSYADNDGVTIYYEADGTGDPVAFLGEAGFGAWQWGWQHAAVAGPYESIVLDIRGTGRSDGPPGPYHADHLVGDLEAVLSDHGVRSAHVVGAGLGGLIALRAAETTGRVRSLTLFGTAARGDALAFDPMFGDPDDPDRLRSSLRAVFSDDFLEAQPDAIAQIVEWRSTEDADRDAFSAQVAAALGVDLQNRLFEVTVPALVVHGNADAVCPPIRGEELADGLPRGEFWTVEEAGHFAHVEHSKPVNDRLLAFLDEREG